MTLVNKRIYLEELHRAFEQNLVSSDALDSKLQGLLTFSSAVVSITATIQVSAFQGRVGFWFWISLFVAVMLYLIMLVMVIRALIPRIYSLPVSMDKDEIKRVYYQVTEEQEINQIVSDHLYFLEKNRLVDASKKSALNWGAVLLVLIVIFLLLALPLGTHFPSLILSDLMKLLPH